MSCQSLFRAASAALLLAGCGHMPVSTMVKLRNFDMASVDPEVLRAAVRLPSALEPRPDGVRLEIEWWPRDAPDRKQIRRIVLEETTAPADVGLLNAEKRSGATLRVYRIRPSQIADLRAAQVEVRVAADACRRGDLPAGRLLSTSWLLPDRATGFLPLIADFDLRSLAKNAEELLEALPACGKFPARAN